MACCLCAAGAMLCASTVYACPRFPRRSCHSPFPSLCCISVFNLTDGINKQEMEAKIAEYQKRNAESIARNEARRVSHACMDGWGLV